MDAGDAARAAMAQRKDVQPEWVITTFGTLVDGLKAATTSPRGAPEGRYHPRRSAPPGALQDRCRLALSTRGFVLKRDHK
jgi:hypothetical protein